VAFDGVLTLQVEPTDWRENGYEFLEDREEVNSVYFVSLENALLFARREALILVSMKIIIMYLHDR
jgi:hypothetical protein